MNETINLAYAEGNTLVRGAELIGHGIGREPLIRLVPPAVFGEVTYFVSDISLERA